MPTGLKVSIKYVKCECHPEICCCLGEYNAYIGSLLIGRYGSARALQVSEAIKQAERSYAD